MDAALQSFGASLAEFLAADASALLELDVIVRVFLQIGLFVASAFFSCSETALFSLSRVDLRNLRRERNPHSGRLHALVDQPRRLIISILTGNELVNIAASANMTGILIRLYDIERAPWISAFVMVPLLLLFAEATPKTIAISDPVRVSTKIVARPMELWVELTAALSWAIRRISDRITTSIVGTEKAPNNILQVDEFRTLVDEGVVSGELSATERAMIHNFLQAGNTEIVEIMTPRTRVFFLDCDAPPSENIEAFKTHRHSRVPVYREQRDNVLGFLHAEDVLRLVRDETDLNATTIDDMLHPPTMVPSTKKIDEMFDYFQDHDIQAATVLNEFGGVDGLITMNDVITYIFGRSQVELPEADASYDPESDGYELPGSMRLIDVNKLTNYGIHDPRMTTIGGVVLRQVDRLPKVGDTVRIEGVTITVLEMESHRVARVRLGKDG